MEITTGVRRLGHGTVNSYLVEDGGEITMVDAGLPGNWRELVDELAAIGRSPADVRAVILTHGHADHIGLAERLRREQRATVHIHELEAERAGRKLRNPANLGPVRPLPMLQFLLYTALAGAWRLPTVAEVSTFGDGAALDVPGSPRITLVPGHTPGSAAIHVPSRRALFVGDAFLTYSVTTGRVGPRLAPFTADKAEAIRSLDRLSSIDVDVTLPGHGEPWTGTLEEAARLVRSSEAARA